jgi:putative membrane-bound dehydrogenase-like protein
MKHLLSLLLLTTALHAEPISLFDGKSLDGWDYDPKIWRVEDGMITGGSTTEKIKENHFICSKKNYQNFELKLKIKVSGDPKTGMLNSGIQIRSLRVPGGAHMTGYQVDCGAGWFGKIYDEFRRNKVIWAPTPEQQAALDKAIDFFGWNEYRIRAEGPRIQTWINGVLCMDYTEADKNIALDGLIGPQVHSGGVCLVQVKDVTIEELAPTPGAPTWESLGGVDAARKLVAPPPKPQADAAAAPKRDISYNNVQGTALTAEEQLKKFHVPEGYEIELVVKESEGLGKFVSVYFDQRGRMWTQTALEYPVDANENPAAAEAVYAAHGKDKVVVYPRESVNGPIPAGGLTKPTVFADGLAIPTGMLPWGNGDTCYVQHGHDLKLYKDTDGDGKADKFDVILTGFGVQDSHLFPHQFTRAPGGWIWMAQGLFNNSKVHKPGSDVVVEYPKCGMARFRPDGSDFEMTSVGPNNIWGLVISGEGETFIQEANDYGYPIMPFHEYAYYPGGMEALKKSYQPDFPPQAEFRMGGTGLSGLALIESGALRDPKAAHTMAVANPITSKIQTIGMHRDGAYWKLEQLPDLITCDDPFFRPVGLTNGPDGYIYIIDWYNKIISHNEVPRAHPDRDKTRGRIWRVKPKGAKTEVADFTKLSSEELNAALKDGPVGKTQIAWQTLNDRKELGANHWAASEYAYPRESVQIRALGRNLSNQNIGELLAFAKPSLPGPTIQSSRGPKQIPVREAYDREFERFLVRMFLERHPDVVAKFLDSEAAAKLPVEARVLASLALEPKTSASRVAKLLPQLDRAPNDEELLRLAQFPAEAGVGDALKALLTNEKSRTVVAEKLLAQRTKLDAKQIAPLLTETAKGMIGSTEGSVRNLALQLIGGFQLVDLEDSLVQPLKMAIAISGGDLRMVVDSKGTNSSDPKDFVASLQVLKDLRSGAADVFVSLATIGKPQVRDAAVEALAASRAPDAAAKLLTLYPSLQPAQRRAALNTLASTKAGAQTIVAALLDKTLPQADLDGPTVERLATVLGNDPALEKLQQQLGGIFREVLLLDGEDTAVVDSKITLDGPFTVEAWVRLAEDISNGDGLLGTPGGVDMNFFGSKFRVYAGGELKDVYVTTKPMTPDLWTHLAVTRDEKGIIRIYQNGELDATGSKPAPTKWENCKIGWSGPKQGTEGVITEFRVWPNARKPAEIRANFDRVLPAQSKQNFKPLEPIDPNNPGQATLQLGKGPGPFGKGARIAKTIDSPPLLTEEQAKALDTKFARFTALAPKGNAANGKVLSALCMACHQIGSAGGQIGPNLSGAGAMGLEAVLRNILTPNAAMEPGYRIYRVEMKNGDLIDAFFVSEDKNATIIRMPGLPDRRLDKKDIRSTKFIRRSLMPEGLLDALQEQQVADLLAYLMTLKG